MTEEKKKKNQHLYWSAISTEHLHVPLWVHTHTTVKLGNVAMATSSDVFNQEIIVRTQKSDVAFVACRSI